MNIIALSNQKQINFSMSLNVKPKILMNNIKFKDRYVFHICLLFNKIALVFFLYYNFYGEV